MAHDVFISYASEDRKTADAICRALEGDGIRCWYAPRDIRSGASWTAAIMDGLASSRLMILVWSSNSNVSPDVTREVQHAFRRHMTVIPFRIEDVEPAKDLAFYLEFVQWFDASTPPLEDNLQHLVTHVQNCLLPDTQVLNSKEEQLQHTQAEAQRKADREAAHERAAEEARSAAEEETRRKSLAEAERLRAEDERQRAEAEAARISLEGSQRQKNASTSERGEDQPAISSLDSDILTPLKSFRHWQVVIPAVILLLVGLAIFYALRRVPETNEQSPPSTVNSTGFQTPMPEPSASGESKIESSIEKPSPTPASTDIVKNVDAPTPTPEKITAPIQGGVLNGKAISLPKPAYPPVAKEANAQGTVTVGVTIDEEGNVISARAVDGHPLLQAAAVEAARRAKFSPTKLSGQPVKVTGIITYNFVK